jgi:hypothetical protein
MSSDQLDPSAPPDDPGNVPPHQAFQAPVPVPMEVSPIHVWIGGGPDGQAGRCMAAFVVNVDAEDPLKAVFTVDAVIFQPPRKEKRDKFDRNNRPGVTRWANNLQYQPVTEKANLTWHYPGRDCLPEVVLDALREQGR